MGCGASSGSKKGKGEAPEAAAKGEEVDVNKDSSFDAVMLTDKKPSRNVADMVVTDLDDFDGEFGGGDGGAVDTTHTHDESELAELCLARLEPGADVVALDKQIKERYEVDGVVAVVAMDEYAVTANYGTMQALSLIMKMRSILYTVFSNTHGRVVKVEMGLMIVAFDSHHNAVKGALLAMLSMKEHNSSVASERDHIDLRIGLGAGKILLLPADCYADALNTASKLCEDVAENGDVMLTHDVVVNTNWSRKLKREQRTVEISGVSLKYVWLDWSRLTLSNIAGMDTEPINPKKGIAPKPIPAPTPFAQMCLERLAFDTEKEESIIENKLIEKYEVDGVAFVSDMSGFTRITRERGISHFLSLIYKMRKEVRPIIESHEGEIVSAQADNYYCVFPTPMCAFEAAVEIQHVLFDLNKDVDDKLSHIRLGVGLDMGKMLHVAEEEAFFGAAADFAFSLGEDMSNPGEVLMTNEVYSAIEGKLDAEIDEKVSFQEREVDVGDGPTVIVAAALKWLAVL